jgi:hypothetical protein
LSFPINTSNFGFFLQNFILILATALTNSMEQSSSCQANTS